ncbi:MAG: enoyl-CoA hydratase/isomerase family protein [Acidimicrobiia bacterium]
MKLAVIELAPGPLADVAAARCSRLLAELEDLADDPPRALLLLAPDGIGIAEPRPPTPAGLRDPAALLAAFPAPTLAAWNGPAVGAGAELLLAADIRMIGAAATMSFPEVGAGALPCWGGTQRLTRAAGVSVALRMVMVGDPLDAESLVRTGLALSADDPVERAHALGAQLAEGAPRAQAAARDAVQRGRDLTLADALRLESDLNLLISTTGDRAEGIAAFFEKRAPKFTGE